MKRSSDSISRKTARRSFTALLASIGFSSVAIAAVSFIGLSTFGGTCNGTTGVSWDGSIAVGWVGDFTDVGDPLYPASFEAARWTNGGEPELLGILPGHARSAAVDVSADGLVEVGAQTYSFREVSGWLGKAGFQEHRYVDMKSAPGFGLILGTKPAG